MSFKTAKDRLAVGIDVTGRDAALRMLDMVGDEAGIIKIGHRLAYSGGFSLIEELAQSGKRIFADLKLLDIDQTVAEGARSVAAAGAAYLTVHAYPKAMRAAVEALGSTPSMKLLGVTVLTSMDDADLADAGYTDSAEALVMKRAQQAKAAGIPGLICSALEAANLRATLGPDMLLVTPGIRFADGDVGDQKRVVTPQKAIADGADIVVMARPIIADADPKAAARRAVEEIEAGLAQRG